MKTLGLDPIHATKPKTMIAQNICHAAVLAGHSVLFRAAPALLEELHRQTLEGRRRKLRTYANVGLLCIDEVGYLIQGRETHAVFVRCLCQRKHGVSRLIARPLDCAGSPNTHTLPHTSPPSAGMTRGGSC